MATAGVPLWSTTASNNATADPAVNMAEGMAPSAVNDGVRALMASVAKWRDDLYGITTGGTSTAYTITTGSTFVDTAAMSGAIFTIIPHADSGASPTLAVDGLTAYAINVSTGVAVATGALITGTPYLVKYVHATTEFILLGNVGVNLLSALNITGATAETAPAIDDELPIYDLSATANRKMTLANILKVLNGLTEDTSPDKDADYTLSYDTSATAVKKVKLGNMPSALPRGYIDGCIMSNGTDTVNDINIGGGVCRDSTNTFNITCAAMTGKQLDANWASGSNAGMRETTGIADQTYHIHAVAKADGTQDYFASSSPTEATALAQLVSDTADADWIYARRIGSIIRASASIVLFDQNGDEFLLYGEVQNYISTSTGTSAILTTLTVPTGIAVWANVQCELRCTAVFASTVYGFISAYVQNDAVPASNMYHMRVTGNGSTSLGSYYSGLVRTTTSGQIRHRYDTSGANIQAVIHTKGWVDKRGKA